MDAYTQIILVYLCFVVFLICIVLFFEKHRSKFYCILSAIAVVAIIFSISTFTRMQLVPFNADTNRKDFLLAGDEPAYFMTAVSIAQDGDFNIANNASNKDYLLFERRPYSGSDFSFYNTLSNGRLESKQDKWGDARYMRHRPGTSILIAPAFLLADHNQRFWSYTIISLLFSMFCGLFICYSYMIHNSSLPGLLVVVLVCGLSPPVYFYLNQAYPEIPAGILLSIIALLFLSPVKYNLLPFCLAAIVIWFTDRVILATLIVSLGGFINLPSRKLKFYAFCILGFSGFLFACYCWHRFGVPYPVSHNMVMGFSYDKIPVRLLQIIFDARYGWVWQFPVVLLLPAMIWQVLNTRRDFILHCSLILSLIALLCLVASFDDWPGGTCPRGRYFVIPQLLVMVLGICWLKGSNEVKSKFFWLIALGGLGLVQIPWLSLNPKWWYAQFQPFFVWKDIHFTIFYLPFLPDDAKASEWMKLLKMLPLLALPSLSCLYFELREKFAGS
jgi:hypothetical protein